jgi:hypothetical protein
MLAKCGGQEQALLAELLDAALVAIEPAGEVHGVVFVGLLEVRRVARGQVVDALVVGVEEVRGVEPGSRRERAAARGQRVVGELRLVARVPRDHVVVTGVAGRGGEHHHLLQVVQRHRRLVRLVLQGAVRDLRAHGEAPCAPAEQCLDQRELEGAGQPDGRALALLHENPTATRGLRAR